MPQEDIEMFVSIITDWLNQRINLKTDDYLNEDVHIQDEDNDYSEEDYEDFIGFVNDKLGIENEIDIHIEKEPTSDYTTGNYNPKENKVKIRNNGRKLVDLLRSIAHELVHHKQNELGKINPPVPEIGGEIEDQANVDAGRLVKYYGKMKPEIYEGKNPLVKEITPIGGIVKKVGKKVAKKVGKSIRQGSSLGTTMIFPIDSDNFNIGYDKQGLGRDVKPKVLDANKALHHCNWRGFSYHEGGIDIFGPEGEPMVSPADGVVTHITTTDVGNPGKSIHIQRPDGITFVLMHLQSIRNLKIGDHLSAGETVGTLGKTGNAKGTHPHLHFSIYDATGYGDNIWRAYQRGNVNPCPYIKSSLGQYTIKEELKKTIKKVLYEEKVVGFNSPSNNFVVVAGGPGAGKSFITKNLINLDNVKDFNVDQIRVMTAKKLWGDEWEEKISTEEGYQKILDMTFTTSDPRNLTVKFLKQFLQSERDQPVNVIYDAGGGQEKVMKDVHQIAKDSGFNTTLIYVRTPLEVAQQRNLKRPRSLPNDMVAQYHQQVKDNMRNMVPIFDNVWTVDNKESIDLDSRPSDNIEKIK
jgi:predicted kinase